MTKAERKKRFTNDLINRLEEAHKEIIENAKIVADKNDAFSLAYIELALSKQESFLKQIKFLGANIGF